MQTCKLFTAPAVKEIFGGADPPTQTNQPECLLFMGEPVCSYLHDKSPPRVKESAHDFTPLSHSTPRSGGGAHVGFELLLSTRICVQ